MKPYSVLDDYVASLNRKYFSVAAGEGTIIVFRYDYHRLLRWLLKAWYNDSRSAPRNVEEHRRFVPYILGQVPEPPGPITLLVGLLGSFRPAANSTVGPEAQMPKVLRFGTTSTVNREAANDLLLARMLSINAYLFHLFVWRPGVGRKQRREHARGLEAEWDFRELRAHRQQIVVGVSKVDTLRYLAARDTSGCMLRKRAL